MLEPHEFEISANMEDESLDLRYVATEAGEMQLHVWAEDTPEALAKSAAGSPDGPSLLSSNAYAMAAAAMAGSAGAAKAGGGDALAKAGGGGDGDGSSPQAAAKKKAQGNQRQNKRQSRDTMLESRMPMGPERKPLPGSPFKLLVMAAKANNSGSFIEGIAREVEEKIEVKKDDETKKEKDKKGGGGDKGGGGGGDKGGGGGAPSSSAPDSPEKMAALGADGKIGREEIIRAALGGPQVRAYTLSPLFQRLLPPLQPLQTL